MNDDTSLALAMRDLLVHLRNFLLDACPGEFLEELRVSREMGDHFRSRCILKLAAEAHGKETAAILDSMAPAPVTTK